VAGQWLARATRSHARRGSFIASRDGFLARFVISFGEDDEDIDHFVIRAEKGDAGNCRARDGAHA
jgi:hypothetical protein